MRCKIIYVSLLFMMNSFAAKAQTDTTTKNQQDVVFDKVEIEASFPGGDEAWRKYLERTLNANVPVDNNAPVGQYTVVVQFVVDRFGNISDVKAVTAHGFGMEKEVIRVIKTGPKWNPAIQDGHFVKAYRRQPVTFVIQEEKKKKKNKD